MFCPWTSVTGMNLFPCGSLGSFSRKWRMLRASILTLHMTSSPSRTLVGDIYTQSLVAIIEQPIKTPPVTFYTFIVTMAICSVQTGKQHQHVEEWDEDWSNTCEEEAAQSLPSPRTCAEEKEGEPLTCDHLHALPLTSAHLILFSFEQSIADLNRSSNGGNSKRISLDSSHLDSSRDTDTGTPFSSPHCKTSKPASDTEDRWDSCSGITTWTWVKLKILYKNICKIAIWMF